MEQADKDLISKLSPGNIVLRRLHREHLALEEKIASLEKRNFLTADETTHLKDMKRKKLSGVDKMMQIIHSAA